MEAVCVLDLSGELSPHLQRAYSLFKWFSYKLNAEWFIVGLQESLGICLFFIYREPSQAQFDHQASHMEIIQIHQGTLLSTVLHESLILLGMITVKESFI